MRLRDIFVLLLLLFGSFATLYTFTNSPTGAVAIQWIDRAEFFLSPGVALTINLDESFSSSSPLRFTIAEQPELYVVLDGSNLIVAPSPGAIGSIPLSITAFDGVDTFEQTVVFVVGGVSTSSEPPEESAPSMAPSSEPIFYLLSDPPNITGINLNSTNPATNDTNQNLTLYINATVASGDLFNITDWRLNGTSIAVLNMPFETNSSSIATDAIRDYGIFENNGTLGGGTASFAPVWNGTSIVGGAYTFDGIDNYIEIGDSASLNITGTNITVEAWINTPEAAPFDYDRIVVKQVAGNVDPYIRYGIFREGSSTGKIGFTVATGGAGSGTSVYTTTGIATNVWHHIVGTYDGATLSIYTNGTLNNSVAKTGSIGSTARPVVIGADTEASIEYFSGTIDEVRVYNRTLSSAQIMENYLEGASHHHVMNLTSQETEVGDVWTVAVTPNNHTDEGSTNISNNVTIGANITSCPVTVTSTAGISGNITSSGTCITVTGSNLMINCQNYSIRGSGTGYGIKVNPGSNNVIIANCNMSGFASAIFADPVGLIIENSTFENSTVGLDLNNTINSTVRNNTFRNNTIGLRLNISQNNTISNNTFSTDNNISAWLIDSLNDTFATTNFTTFLVLENSSASGGIINFTQWVYIENVSNLNSTVYTVFNRSFINATANQQLNRSAELTFRGLAFSDPSPVVDSNDDDIWETCSICTEKSYSGGTFIFNVTHWTSYAAVDSAASCPITITVNTTLTSNYVGYLNTTDACITIGASNIMLDCAGYSLTSNGSGRGVRASSRRNIIAKNCTVSNFTDGFSFFQVNESTVTNNTVFNSSDDNYDLSTMNRSNITNNSGVHSTDDNIIFVRSDNNTISGNLVDNATGASASNGIVLFNMSNNNTIQQNIVTNSQEAGITAQLQSNSNRIMNNTVAYSQDDNIYIADSNYNIVDNNTITNSSDDNIELNNASFASVVNNNLTRAFDNLMSIFNSSDNNVTNNIFFNTSDPSSTANGLTILSASQNNVIQNNSFFQTQNDTIFSSNSYNNTIMSNTIFLSGDDGIRLENTSNFRIQFNNITDSAEQGIDVENSSQLLIANNNASNNTENNIRLRNSTLSNVSNNTASNATGTAFPDGIEIDHGSRDIIVFNNTLSFNADGLQLLNATNVTATFNRIFNNTDDGIDINSSGQNISSNVIYYNQFGVSFTPGNSTTVENNTIFNNTNDGVLITRQSNHLLVIRNIIQNHTSVGSVGINIIGNETLQQNITLQQNNISNIGGNGIQVINLTRQLRIINNNITRVGVSNATAAGIYMTNVSDVNISTNNLSNSSNFTVRILDSSNASVEFNFMENSTGDFIHIERANLTLLNNNSIVTNNQFEFRLVTAGNVTILNHIFANYSIASSGLAVRDAAEAEIYYLNRSMTQSNSNWSSDVRILYNSTFVNATNAPGLNQSANLTFFGLLFVDPKALVDVEGDGTFVDCTSAVCTEISYSGGTFIYNVTHWTNHSSGENSSVSIAIVDGTYNATITPEQVAICTFQTDNLSAAVGCAVVDDNTGGNVTALSIRNNGTAGFGLNVSASGCPFESGCIQQMKVNGTAGLSLTATCNPALNFITIPNTGSKVNLHKNVSPGEMVFIHLNYTFSIPGTPPGAKNISYNFTAVTDAPYFDPAC